MLHIGCHLSASKGYYAMGKTALSIGADTFQFFTRNPRGSRAKPLDLNDAQKLNELAAENHFAVLLAHAPYTINPCSANEDTRTFARETMQDDLKRLEATPHNLYNFHPGSHVGQGIETGVTQISETLNAILSSEQTTTVLLETMAGKGTEVGSHFEELREILDRVTLSDHMGVCLDTCHVFDAGYDIVNDLDGTHERQHLRAFLSQRPPRKDWRGQDWHGSVPPHHQPPCPAPPPLLSRNSKRTPRLQSRN